MEGTIRYHQESEYLNVVSVTEMFLHKVSTQLLTGSLGTHIVLTGAQALNYILHPYTEYLQFSEHSGVAVYDFYLGTQAQLATEDLIKEIEATEGYNYKVKRTLQNDTSELQRVLVLVEATSTQEEETISRELVLMFDIRKGEQPEQHPQYRDVVIVEAFLTKLLNVMDQTTYTSSRDLTQLYFIFAIYFEYGITKEYVDILLTFFEKEQPQTSDWLNQELYNEVLERYSEEEVGALKGDITPEEEVKGFNGEITPEEVVTTIRTFIVGLNDETLPCGTVFKDGKWWYGYDYEGE